jgi:hypothetical protein
VKSVALKKFYRNSWFAFRTAHDYNKSQMPL